MPFRACVKLFITKNADKIQVMQNSWSQLLPGRATTQRKNDNMHDELRTKSAFRKSSQTISKNYMGSHFLPLASRVESKEQMKMNKEIPITLFSIKKKIRKKEEKMYL